MNTGCGKTAAAERSRTARLRHLRECAHCRGRLAAEDPSRLFSLLVLEAPPEGLLDTLSRRVAADVSLAEKGQPRRRLAWGPTAVAASLVLAGLAGAYLWTWRAPPGAAAARAARGNVVEVVPVSGQRAPAAAIELISSPGTAQVHHLTVGDTQLTMIFDEALDL